MESMEERILACAEKLFLERGFDGTNMSDIALSMGINRPTLHYYFRTKDKMFRAVLARIVLSFVPRVYDIVVNSEKPVAERISQVFDAYMAIFLAKPCLPLFMAREVQRDFDFLLRMLQQEQIDRYVRKIIRALEAEMDAGKLKKVPLRTLFYTFYGLMVFPFLSRRLTESLLLAEGETFEEMLEEWKRQVVAQVCVLLA
ncbi:MAG: TetR/AcrR family transcriptional regulator [Candidatus Bacteroides intestinipullorum]|uniref:TetR/AcrR family transcriptional regulator n=1 Tax=Candidatus Bacteroides intestinipullorum TaxID=2838471 RepID=A0A9E2KGW7_9BACE|nr:TetR/AcrR family transcriptional regulator [Candidatus Bacteroides intestinipullorum]